MLRLANQGATPAELAKIKTQVLTQALLTRQTPEGLASAVAEAAVLEGNPAQVNQGLVDLQRVNIADVKRVLQKYIVSAHRVTIEYTQEGAAK